MPPQDFEVTSGSLNRLMTTSGFLAHADENEPTTAT